MNIVKNWGKKINTLYNNESEESVKGNLNKIGKNKWKN